jgi:plasmid stabilization system protein ParE
MGVTFRPEAAADIAMAVGWYELQQSGLGESFLVEVKFATDYVAGQPECCAIIHRNTRRLMLRRFPYCLYYRLIDQQIVVVACFHSSRKPGLWKRRR